MERRLTSSSLKVDTRFSAKTIKATLTKMAVPPRLASTAAPVLAPIFSISSTAQAVINDSKPYPMTNRN